MTKRRLLVYGAAVLIIAAISAPGTLAESHTKAGARCDKLHPLACRQAVAYLRHEHDKTLRALAWQKEHARREIERVLTGARGAQPFAYAAKLAHAACVTFEQDPKRCKPPGEMLRVGRCESGLQNHDPNPVSSADGWLQYLDSTWAAQPIARLGFSLYDPLAMALAGEAMSRRGWGAWRASIACHGLY